MDLHLHRSLGHVQEIFTPEVIERLPARRPSDTPGIPLPATTR